MGRAHPKFIKAVYPTVNKTALTSRFITDRLSLRVRSEKPRSCGNLVVFSEDKTQAGDLCSARFARCDKLSAFDGPERGRGRRERGRCCGWSLTQPRSAEGPRLKRRVIDQTCFAYENGQCHVGSARNFPGWD